VNLYNAPVVTEKKPMLTDVNVYSQNEVFVLRQKVEAVLCVATVASSGDESSAHFEIGKDNCSKPRSNSLWRLERLEPASNCFGALAVRRGLTKTLGKVSPGGGRKDSWPSRPGGMGGLTLMLTSCTLFKLCNPGITNCGVGAAGPFARGFGASCTKRHACPRVHTPFLLNSKQGLGLGRSSVVEWANVHSVPILHSFVFQNLHMRVNCTAFFCSDFVMATVTEVWL